MSTSAGSAHEIPIPNEPRRVRTNSCNPGEAEAGRTDPSVRSRRPGTAGEVRGVDEDRSADVDDRRGGGDPLVVDRDRLRAGLPQLRRRPHEDRPPRRGSRWVAARLDRLVGVLELEDDAGPGRGGSARRLYAPLRARRSASGGGVSPRPPVDRRTCPRSARIRAFSWSCWAWRPRAVSTSGVRSWLVYRTRGASRRAGRRSGSRAEQRRPQASCQLGIPRTRPVRAAHRGGSSGSTGPASGAPPCTPPA